MQAIVLPVIITSFLTFSRYLFIPRSEFGIGTPNAIQDLDVALRQSSRSTLALVNNGLSGGLIDQAIDQLAAVGRNAGKEVSLLSDSARLPGVCVSSLRGVSDCYGAVQFWSSPEEGDGGIWNYTIRLDAALGFVVRTGDSDNDQQVYILPLQKAVDTIITTLAPGDNGGPLPETINEYPFTDMTQEEREADIRRTYQSIVRDYLAIAFIIGLIGVVYQMTGFVATEREIGMSQLVEAMMPSRYSWSPQAIRLLSYHLSFSMLYLPANIISAIIVSRGIFVDTSAAIIIVYYILAGWSFTSLSILGASFFKKSQLSGVSVTIFAVILGILSQVFADTSTVTVVLLSLLFVPCNFVYFFGWLTRFQENEQAAHIGNSAPESTWAVPGVAFWIFLILQIFLYPTLGALVERYLYGSTSNARQVLLGTRAEEMGEDAVRLDGFTKIYKPNIFSRMSGSKNVHAVKQLHVSARKGQILGLLGANGSGKSTTLDAIAGTNRLSDGTITIDGTGGLGIAPQKNVMWDQLTVEEHIRIFNRLKAPDKEYSKSEIRRLVKSIDLEPKREAQSKTLSGGQKRKLQLGMMLTGGSAVCCIDEVSSGLDPLSRRKIWDILLAERGNRTIILTTHFLDEADLLCDQIAILSKGTLRATGSSVQLKDTLGGGYRIHLHGTRSLAQSPDIEGVRKNISFDVTTYIAPSSALAAQVIKTLEAEKLTDYRFSGPTIEDVFLQLAEEAQDDRSSLQEKPPSSPDSNARDPETNSVKEGLELLPGRRIGFLRQTVVLLLKRSIISRRNWLPYLAAFVIPIIAAGLTTLIISDEDATGCSPADQASRVDFEGIQDILDELVIVSGPSSRLSIPTLASVVLPALGGFGGGGDFSANSDSTTSALESFRFVDTYEEFTAAIEADRKNISPGGFWLGDENSTPTLAWVGGEGMFFPGYAQTVFHMLLTNTTIVSAPAIFDLPFPPSLGDSLQLLVYFSLAMSAWPGFMALYPNVERRRQVRGLQYSNGVRSFPLWLAHVIFDFSIMLVSMAVVIIIWATMSNIWYHVAYLFPVFMLYAFGSVLLAYIISLFCGSQLSAYAITAAGQAIVFLAYVMATMNILSYSRPENVDRDLGISNWVISVVAPMGPLVRALFVSLNIFSAACSDEELNPNPGSFLAYGGPIMYLVLQSAAYFLFLVLYDSGAVVSWFKRMRRSRGVYDDHHPNTSDEEVAAELVRVTTSLSATATRGADGRMSMPNASTARSQDGLRVVHLTKQFGNLTAVDNISFGVQRGEVFALLGPNGAGKSTTISIIRGDLTLSARGGGDVFVEDISVTKQRAKARAHLGVCPQFDAVDNMTVVEHLRFYAQVRGVKNVEYNVRAVIQAVGLKAYKDRIAGKLSGGNKRKLSLGIALMGNPTVMLLDEPSSGLDAAAKRIMWRTLADVVPGRSILLTTHSMEEADALAGRAGILSRRMLAMGTAEGLRNRWGNMLYVHLVCQGAPRTEDAVLEGVSSWVWEKFGVEVEDRSWHGQIRFKVPVDMVASLSVAGFDARAPVGHGVVSGGEAGKQQSALGKLVVVLEEEKARLGVEHFSVSPTMLDQVFLNVVGKHNVKEENYDDNEEKKSWWRRRGWKRTEN